jgi:hypothetical protein
MIILNVIMSQQSETETGIARNQIMSLKSAVRNIYRRPGDYRYPCYQHEKTLLYRIIEWH